MSQPECFVSIVVCTYNRASLLDECVNSLIVNTADPSSYEIIIVNNNSNDDTQEIAEKYAGQYANVRVVNEMKQGICFARNRGFHESKGDYVAYMDDDAIARQDWIQRLLALVKQNRFDAVGGIYLPWYRNGRPEWMKDSYVSNKTAVERAVKNIPGEYFFCGGNFLIKKDVLNDLQGFSTEIGMTGYKVGYGQEDELQVRMKKKGYSIGFDDKLLIEHYVAPYKQNVKWFIISRFCKGRDSWIAHHQFPSIIKLLIYLVLVFYKPIAGLPGLIEVLNPAKEQRIQNFLIEKFGASAFYLGRFISGAKLYLNDEREKIPSA